MCCLRLHGIYCHSNDGLQGVLHIVVVTLGAVHNMSVHSGLQSVLYICTGILIVCSLAAVLRFVSILAVICIGGLLVIACIGINSLRSMRAFSVQ